MLKMWKGNDSAFPFNDSHNKNYNVRDGSDWESTLKPRLRERIRNSKNMILILSSVTKNSRALREEIEYGINNQGLPVIVIYPEFSEKSDIADSDGIKKQIKELWNNLSVFRDNMNKVPTLHIPCKKELIKSALQDGDYMINTKGDAKVSYYQL